MDEALGVLFENLPEDTLLVVTADHGEEFGEYGQYSHHSDKLVPILTHVPLIISGPSVKPQKVDEQVSSLSIAPTILEANGYTGKLGTAPSLWKRIST